MKKFILLTTLLLTFSVVTLSQQCELLGVTGGESITPQIRSASSISGAYIQVLFYDNTLNETGFVVELASVNHKGISTEDWRVVATTPPGEGVSQKGSWGNWQTWQMVRIPAEIVNLHNKQGFKIRVKAFLHTTECYVESEYGVAESWALWKDGKK